MSKFIEKLRRCSERSIQPMGFKSSKPANSHAMLLISALTAKDTTKASRIVKEQVDAIVAIIDTPVIDTSILKKLMQGNIDLPWGLWFKEVTKETVEQLSETGNDFTIFEATSTSALVLNKQDRGNILVSENFHDPTLVRAIGQLGIDAVIIHIAHEKQMLTVDHLLRCRQIAALTQKPIIATTEVMLAQAEVQALWEAGACGLMVTGESGKSENCLSELRKITNSLSPSAKAKRGHEDVILPSITPQSQSISEDADDDFE